MVVHHAVEHLRIEVAARLRLAPAQMVEEVVLERALEPFVHGNAEPDLLALEDRARNEAASGLAQDPLGLEPVHAAAVGKRRDEARELVVEERHARLDRGGHRHAVAALEEIVGEPARLVEVEDAAKRRRVRMRVERREVLRRALVSAPGAATTQPIHAQHRELLALRRIERGESRRAANA